MIVQVTFLVSEIKYPKLKKERLFCLTVCRGLSSYTRYCDMAEGHHSGKTVHGSQKTAKESNQQPATIAIFFCSFYSLHGVQGLGGCQTKQRINLLIKYP